MPRQSSTRSKSKIRTRKTSDAATDDEQPIHEIDPLDFHCGICLTTLHRPVTLECGHSSCEHCLSSFLANFLDGPALEMRCPFCNQTLAIPYSTTFLFPAINTILNNHIQHIFPLVEATNRQQYLDEYHQVQIEAIRQRLSNGIFAPEDQMRNWLEEEDPDPAPRPESCCRGFYRNGQCQYRRCCSPAVAKYALALQGDCHDCTNLPNDHVMTTYSSLVSWLLFVVLAMLLVTIELYSSSAGSNVAYPHSTSSFMYLTRPVRDLPSFYKQYSSSSGSSTPLIPLTPLTPLEQLLTQPNTIRMSEWLQRDPTSPFYFSKRHLIVVMFVVSISSPRTAATLWLMLSSHGAIATNLLSNPWYTSLMGTLWDIGWNTGWSNVSRYV